MSYSYRQLIDRNLGGISPTSEQILQDINPITISYQRIIDAKRTIIEDTQQTGRQYVKREAYQKERWGGARKKNVITAEEMPRDTTLVLHDHAKQYKAHRLELTQKQYCRPDSGTVSCAITLTDTMYNT